MTRDEEIAFCREQRQKAWTNLNLLVSGMTVKRGPSGGRLRDVTDEHKEREREQFNYWTQRLAILGVNDPTPVLD